MIDGKKVLAIVPARGGSKGVPRKNLRNLGGKPLIAWTIAACKGSRYVDRLIVSTDDKEIAIVARNFGAEVPFMRDAALAQDDTPGIDPVLDALDRLPGFDFVVLLQPTSPLRESTDIDGALDACIAQKAPACVSMVRVSEHPKWMFRLDERGRIQSYESIIDIPVRRQDLAELFIPNGAVYVARVDWLRQTRKFFSDETLAFAMSAELSIDIDTPLDFIVAEAILASKSRSHV